MIWILISCLRVAVYFCLLWPRYTNTASSPGNHRQISIISICFFLIFFRYLELNHVHLNLLNQDQSSLRSFLQAEKGDFTLFCLIENGPAEFAAPYNCGKDNRKQHIWNTSRPCLVNNDLLYVVQRRRAPLSWRRKRRERIWSTYHDILTYIMHSAAGYGGWFIPAMCESRCICVRSSLDRICLTTKEPHQSCTREFRYWVQMRSESQQAFRESFFSALQLSALLSSRRLSTVSMCTLANIDSTKAETTWGCKEAYIACEAKPETFSFSFPPPWSARRAHISSSLSSPPPSISAAL